MSQDSQNWPSSVPNGYTFANSRYPIRHRVKFISALECISIFSPFCSRSIFISVCGDEILFVHEAALLRFIHRINGNTFSFSGIKPVANRKHRRTWHSTLAHSVFFFFCLFRPVVLGYNS